jgi:hypothetical protein
MMSGCNDALQRESNQGECAALRRECGTIMSTAAAARPAERDAFVDKDSAYQQITDNGGEPYARYFAAQNPDHPLTPFCYRYLFEKDQEARTAKQDEERGFALKSLAQMESSSHIAQAAASASRDAATAAHTSALSARRSAFWTMIAAIASALGVVVNAALNLGWLDWARHVVP